MYNFGAGQENCGCKCTHCTHKFGALDDMVFGNDFTYSIFPKYFSGKLALNSWYDIIYDKTEYGHCIEPCLFFSIASETVFIKDILNPKYVKVNLNFEDVIQVSKSYYIFSGISLLGEIGGYVGLFLGVSVNQLTTLLVYSFSRFEQFLNYVKSST